MSDESCTMKKDARDLHVMENPNRACPGKIEVPTEKERDALKAMKAIKEQVRALKKRLPSLHASDGDEGTDEVLRPTRVDRKTAGVAGDRAAGGRIALGGRVSGRSRAIVVRGARRTQTQREDGNQCEAGRGAPDRANGKHGGSSPRATIACALIKLRLYRHRIFVLPNRQP